MAGFNQVTKLLAILLIVVLIAQGVATMTLAGKDKPPTQQDIAEFIVGVLLIVMGGWIGVKLYDTF
jgi:hypothetical protein